MDEVVTILKIIYKNIVMKVKSTRWGYHQYPTWFKANHKDTYITFKKQPIFKNGDVLIFDKLMNPTNVKLSLYIMGTR